MVVKVLYFASFRDRVGRDEEQRSRPTAPGSPSSGGASPGEVPHFAAFPSMPPAAVNREYADAATVLEDGDEVAFLPPVAGG